MRERSVRLITLEYKVTNLRFRVRKEISRRVPFPLTKPAATTAGRVFCSDRADMLRSVEYVGIWMHVSVHLNGIFKGGQISEIGIEGRSEDKAVAHVKQN